MSLSLVLTQVAAGGGLALGVYNAWFNSRDAIRKQQLDLRLELLDLLYSAREDLAEASRELAQIEDTEASESQWTEVREHLTDEVRSGLDAHGRKLRRLADSLIAPDVNELNLRLSLFSPGVTSAGQRREGWRREMYIGYVDCSMLIDEVIALNKKRSTVTNLRYGGRV